MLLLIECTHAPPGSGKLEVTAPAVAPAPPLKRAPSPPVRTSWTFRTSEDECAATAEGTGTSLIIAIRRDTPIRLVLSLPAQPERTPVAVPLRFNGLAGNWQVSARRTARQVTVTLGSDDAALSRILVLLSGGVLEVGEAAQPLVALVISPSEAPGQIWFDCARAKML
jgi:hypothetical protein